MTLKIKFFFERMSLIQRKHFMLSEPAKSIKNLLVSCGTNRLGFKDLQDNHGNLGDVNYRMILRSSGELFRILIK